MSYADYLIDGPPVYKRRKRRKYCQCGKLISPKYTHCKACADSKEGRKK